MNVEKHSLGLFKGKEKKAVQEKIDAAKKEIEKKIVLLQQRITEIDVELTKAR